MRLPLLSSTECPYGTNLLRAALGLIVGAAVGAAAIMIYYLTDLAQNLGSAHFYEFGFAKGRGIFAIAFILWSGGLLAIGTLPWWLLHRRNVRSWHAALGLGFTLSFSLSFGLGLLPSGSFSFSDGRGAIIKEGKRTPYGWRVLFSDSVKFGALGGLVGIVVWRTAYRRVSAPSHKTES